LNRIQALATRCLDDLRHGRIPPEKLVIRHTLSRALREYKAPSPAAIAARQLEQAGKFLRPGQIVRFIYTLGEPGVRAWDLVEVFNPKTINIPIYKILLNRMMQTIMILFGVEEEQQLHFPIPSTTIHQILHSRSYKKTIHEFTRINEYRQPLFVDDPFLMSHE
jgi:DNA polymerase elongation subunit (family B)